MAIKWQEPPKLKTPSNRVGNGRWQKVANELKARTGEWALVGTDVSAGAPVQLKKYGVETTLRKVKRGRAGELYARYVGGGDDE